MKVTDNYYKGPFILNTWKITRATYFKIPTEYVGSHPRVDLNMISVNVRQNQTFNTICVCVRMRPTFDQNIISTSFRLNPPFSLNMISENVGLNLAKDSREFK
jgi:hypothetical protein